MVLGDVRPAPPGLDEHRAQVSEPVRGGRGLRYVQQPVERTPGPVIRRLASGAPGRAQREEVLAEPVGVERFKEAVLVAGRVHQGVRLEQHPGGTEGLDPGLGQDRAGLVVGQPADQGGDVHDLSHLVGVEGRVPFATRVGLLPVVPLPVEQVRGQRRGVGRGLLVAVQGVHRGQGGHVDGEHEAVALVAQVRGHLGSLVAPDSQSVGEAPARSQVRCVAVVGRTAGEGRQQLFVGDQTPGAQAVTQAAPPPCVRPRDHQQAQPPPEAGGDVLNDRLHHADGPPLGVIDNDKRRPARGLDTRRGEARPAGRRFPSGPVRGQLGRQLQHQSRLALAPGAVQQAGGPVRPGGVGAPAHQLRHLLRPAGERHLPIPGEQQPARAAGPAPAGRSRPAVRQGSDPVRGGAFVAVDDVGGSVARTGDAVVHVGEDRAGRGRVGRRLCRRRPGALPVSAHRGWF